MLTPVKANFDLGPDFSDGQSLLIGSPKGVSTIGYSPSQGDSDVRSPGMQQDACGESTGHRKWAQLLGSERA